MAAPGPKMADSDVTKLAWVTTLADPLEPTIAELNAGVDITCATVAGGTLGATASDTDNTKSVCDTANVDNPTFDNYDAQLKFFRTGSASDTTSSYALTHAALKVKGVVGFLVRRIDPAKGAADAFAAADKVEIYKVMTDNPVYASGAADGAPVQFSQNFLKQGFMALDVAVVAS